MLDLLPWAQQAKDTLRGSEEALAYLRSRNILPSVIEQYDIGFVKRFFPINSETPDAEQWNKTFCSGKFPSTNRLVFPHYDDNPNKVIGFSTRSLSSKYYSHFLSEYASFKGVFWGWKQAVDSIWETKTVIITEGIFDLLSVSHIRKDVICSLTRSLSDSQFKRILRYVDKVVLAFDMDEPGRKGCEVWANKFSESGKVVKILEYPNKDLNEWWVSDPKNMINQLRL